MVKRMAWIAKALSPMMLIPGVGSYVYRGLATVIVGGMFVSAVFTLILLPSLLRLGESRHTKRIKAPLQAQPETP